MTPAEIAAKLTPAQVRALQSRKTDAFLARIPPNIHQVLTSLKLIERERPTPLGRAVLAVLDGAE